jgi:hypothetical protein
MRLNKEEVGEIIVDFPLQPLFNKVIITLNNLEEDGDLVLSENILSDRQFVIAGSFTFKDVTVSPGDEVLIDIEKMMTPVKTETTNAYEMKMQVKIDPVEVGVNTFAMIEDRFIKAKILK